MRKDTFLNLLLIAFVVVLATCGCHRYSAPNSSEPSLENENTFPLSTSTISLATKTTHSSDSAKKPSYALDEAYENAYAECYSNVEYEIVNEDYAARWKKLGDDYYEAVLNSEFCHEIQAVDHIREIHDDLLANMERRYKQEISIVNLVYGSGSTVPVALTRFRYQQQRAYALEMYSLCCRMLVQCEAP